MNKFEQPVSGKLFTLRTGDLKYDIDAITESLNSLYKASSQYSTFIVFGCNLSQNVNDVNLSEGAIFTGGEYFKVDAKVYSNTTVSVINLYYFDLVSGTDPLGNFVYFDNTAGNLRTVRKATLVQTPTSFSNIQRSTIKDINSDLVNLIPDATTVQKGKIMIASDQDVITGTDITKCITPKQLKDIIPVKIATFQIGAWDMNTNFETTVVTGGIALDKIISVDVIIYKDDLTGAYPLVRAFSVSDNKFSGFINTIRSNGITLNRTDNGLFDTTEYSSILINRGYITINYIN